LVSDIRPNTYTSSAPDLSILIVFEVVPEIIPLLFDTKTSSSEIDTHRSAAIQ
jgi:hypothetical protein